MIAFLSQPWLASRWKTVSGFCTTPMSPPAMTSRRYSGRVGGTGAGKRVTGARSSAMGHCLLFLDAIRKQDVVNAVRQLGAGAVDRIAAVAVELAFDLARVRRHQQDAIADQHGLWDRVRHEQHREARVFPQLQQLFLHLAP